MRPHKKVQVSQGKRGKQETSSGSRSKKGPLRSCWVCRTQHGKGRLVALDTLRDIVSKPDADKQDLEDEAKAKTRSGSKAGRRKYVCITYGCLQKVAKASRRSGADEASAAGFGKALADLARIRVVGCLGLARRCGAVTLGVDAVERHLREGAQGIALRATDLAPRSARKLKLATAVFSSRDLALAMGLGSVGAVWLSPGALGDRLADWLAIWQKAEAFQKQDEQ